MTNANLLFDPVELRKTLELFFKIGRAGGSQSLREIRVMNAVTGMSCGARNLSGFFDSADEAIKAIEGVKSADAFYMSANPVNPAVMARGAAINQLVPASKNSCAGASDIQGRVCLSIDLDPERVSGICATEAERQAAIDKGAAIKKFLASHEWPDPIEGDSGNGCYLIYPIDLPVNDNDLVKHVLEFLQSKFGDAAVHVDPAMAKPAQLIRLFGTMNMKGTSTPERPHRMSRLTQIPAEIKIVLRDLLEKLVKATPVSGNRSTRQPAAGSKGDVAEFIKRHSLTVNGPKDWESDGKKGSLYTFPVCPWNPEHTNDSAFIIQFADGSVAAGCHHTGCAQESWSTLRDKFEPGWRSELVATQYRATPHGFVYRKGTPDGVSEVPLSNFTARITAERVMDDGVEQKNMLEIEASIHGRATTIEVTAGEFGGMSWVTKMLGPTAIIYAGSTIKDHMRAAIQLCSVNIGRRHIYTHTGWVKIDDAWVYLHGGGAVGPIGTITTAEIALPNQLDPMKLPPPSTGDVLKKAVRASLNLLNVAPDHITAPLWCSIFRVILGEIYFSMFLSGATGIGKSALTACFMQHFGAGFDAGHLPASWQSTANANERLLFIAKDLLIPIDDYAPAGSIHDVQRQSNDAGRIFRAVGNGSSRHRAFTDGSIRASKPPRSLILATGEDVPRAHSIRARMLIIEMSKNDMHWDRLSECQRDGSSGLYAQLLSSYLQWIAPRLEQVQAQLKEDSIRLRDQLTSSGVHKRTPDAAASLLAGMIPFLEFIKDVGAVSAEEAATLQARLTTALTQTITAQQQHHEAADPVDQFLELLRSAFMSGHAHLVGGDGEAPIKAQLWGWTPSNHEQDKLIPQGDLVGWVINNNLYLNAGSVFRVAQKMTGSTGESIPVGARTLWKRLHERGLLLSIDSTRGRMLVRQTFQGTRHNGLLHLCTGTIYESGTAQTAQWPTTSTQGA